MMNTKKTIITHAINSFFIIVLASSFSIQAQASEECKDFSLTSYVTLLGPTGPAIGSAEAMLKDGTVFNVSAAGEITSTIFNTDGTMDMRVRELDNWGALGTTVGIDKIKLTPTAIPGEFTFKIKTFILGESGSLEDVFGLYNGTGTASFNDGTLTHSGKGTICNFKIEHVEEIEHIEE